MDNNILTLFLVLSLAAIATATAAELMLSPLISKNHIADARNRSLVNPEYFLNVTSHAGFLTVDERYGSHMYFWYFPVSNKPVNETPWIVWLQGGPGATSLAGLFDEMGAFQYDDAQDKLTLREWSWGKDHSLLFIDNPVGAGYSFTEQPGGYVNDMTTCAEQLYSVLQQFLMMFPELRRAPLYIAGESYAGRYVPAFAMKILHPEVKAIDDLSVNLQGLILGNPVFDRDSIVDYTSTFYQWGLIDSQGVLAAKPLQDAYTKAVLADDNSGAYELRERLLSKLEDMSFQLQLYNVLKDSMEFEGFVTYINRPHVKRAMHVGEREFTFSSSEVHKHLVPDFLEKVRPKIEELLDHYRILIYCGQLDLTAPCVPNARARRKYWHWRHRDQFLNAPRLPWYYNESVAGYVKSGGGLTEVLVRGAGHLVPIERPAQAQLLVSYFIRGLDLPQPANWQPGPDQTPPYADPSAADVGAPSGTRAAMIMSFIVNAVLLAVIAAGLVYYMRWRRRQEACYYSATDEAISEGILTMA